MFAANELSNLKIQAILAALERNAWNRTHAANDLGISVRCIRNNIRLLRAAGFDIPRSPKDRRRDAAR